MIVSLIYISESESTEAGTGSVAGPSVKRKRCSFSIDSNIPNAHIIEVKVVMGKGRHYNRTRE